MDLSTSVLGHYAASRLAARIATPVLTIGRDRFTRSDLATVECFNYVACLLVSRACQTVGVKSTADLFERVSPQALAIPRVGTISFAVVGAAFQAKGVGGATPLAAWVSKHLTKPVTVDALKHRDAEEGARERKTTKARKAARRNEAHRRRLARFETSQAASS